MIKIKNGVCFHPATFRYPQMMRIPFHAAILAPGGYDVTITSGCDGKHKDGSRHYKGLAIDFRTRDFPEGCKLATWRDRLAKRLGDEYFVLIEPDHLHVQWNGANNYEEKAFSHGGTEPRRKSNLCLG
jgi:hypothetical protein